MNKPLLQLKHRRFPPPNLDPTMQARRDVHGVCKWFNEAKGYGFLTADDNSGDAFVHFSAIRVAGTEYRTLSPGDRVTYDVVQSFKGPAAGNVRIIERATVPTPKRKPAA